MYNPPTIRFYIFFQPPTIPTPRLLILEIFSIPPPPIIPTPPSIRDRRVHQLESQVYSKQNGDSKRKRKRKMDT